MIVLHENTKMWFLMVCTCLVVVTMVTTTPIPILLDTNDIIDIHGDMDIPITLKQAENEVLKLPANKRKKIDKLAYYIFVEYMQELMKSEENSTTTNKPDVTTPSIELTTPPTSIELATPPTSIVTGKDEFKLPDTTHSVADFEASNASTFKPMIKPTTQHNNSEDASVNVTSSMPSDNVDVNSTTFDLNMTFTSKPTLATVLYTDLNTAGPVNLTPTTEPDNGNMENSANHTAMDGSPTKPVNTTTPTYTISGSTDDYVDFNVSSGTSAHTTTLKIETSTATVLTAATKPGNAELGMTSATTENYNLSTARVAQEERTNDSTIISIKTGNSSIASEMLYANAKESVALTNRQENATYNETIEISDKNETHSNVSSHENEFQIINSANTRGHISQESNAFESNVTHSRYSNYTETSNNTRPTEMLNEDILKNITVTGTSYEKESVQTDINLTKEHDPVTSNKEEGRSSTRSANISTYSSNPINETTENAKANAQLEWDGI